MNPSIEDRARGEALRYTLEAAKAATWDIDLVNDTVVWSDNAESLLGVAPGTLTPTFEPEATWIHPDDLALTIRALWEATRAGGVYDVEHRTVTADGDVRWVHARGGAIYDEGGNPIRLVGTLVDITDRRRTSDPG